MVVKSIKQLRYLHHETLFVHSSPLLEVKERRAKEGI